MLGTPVSQLNIDLDPQDTGGYILATDPLRKIPIDQFELNGKEISCRENRVTYVGPYVNLLPNYSDHIIHSDVCRLSCFQPLKGIIYVLDSTYVEFGDPFLFDGIIIGGHLVFDGFNSFSVKRIRIYKSIVNLENASKIKGLENFRFSNCLVSGDIPKKLQDNFEFCSQV